MKKSVVCAVLCMLLLFCSSCGTGNHSANGETGQAMITAPADAAAPSDTQQGEPGTLPPETTAIPPEPTDAPTQPVIETTAAAPTPTTAAPNESTSESTTAVPPETTAEDPTAPPEPGSTSSGADADFRQAIDNASESSISFGGKLYPAGADFNTELTSLVYNGNPVTFNMDIYNGGFAFEIGVMIYVSGILQQFNAVMNGQTYSNQKVCSVNLAKNADHVFNISFVPNIGKAGETLDLVVCVMPFSSYVKTDGGYTNGINTINTPILNGYQNIHTFYEPLSMQANAPSVEPVANSFSGASISAYPANLRKMLSNDSSMDWQNTRNVLIYTDPDDVIDSKGEFIKTSFDIKKSANAQVNVLIYGKAGKVRVGFFVNAKPQPVFDGKYYADVTVENNKATVLTLSVDTSALSQFNSAYVISYDAAEPDKILAVTKYESFKMRVR